MVSIVMLLALVIVTAVVVASVTSVIGGIAEEFDLDQDE